MTRKEKLTITIDPEVVDEVDKVRGLIPRSTWIEDRLKKALATEGST